MGTGGCVVCWARRTGRTARGGAGARKREREREDLGWRCRREPYGENEDSGTAVAQPSGRLSLWPRAPCARSAGQGEGVHGVGRALNSPHPLVLIQALLSPAQHTKHTLTSPSKHARTPPAVAAFDKLNIAPFGLALCTTTSQLTPVLAVHTCPSGTSTILAQTTFAPPHRPPSPSICTSLVASSRPSRRQATVTATTTLSSLLLVAHL